MAHEITKHDHVMLAGEKAWHGLGTIVEEATPKEALRIAKLDWKVTQQTLHREVYSEQYHAEGFQVVGSHVANVRMDTNTVLGIVGKDWTPFQNDELAAFCEALHEEGNVKVESAGSIRGGQRVWFLLKGEQFAIKNNDEIFPYICVSNGFDGGTSLRCTPTTIRVVCSNTLHMVIPKREKTGRIAGLREAAYVVRHTGGLKARVEEARLALKEYNLRLQENKALMEELANVNLNTAKLKKFFLEMHQRHFGVIKDNPTTKTEMRKHTRAMDGLQACLSRFESERKLAGATAWNAFNAYTGMLQHDYASNRKDATVRAEAKLSTNLFGTNADRTIETFRAALQLAT
jgi:phage/plasmid-like protein (TIGR03299 family)